jgi:geranylgeranyl pyrophosphate synthase
MEPVSPGASASRIDPGPMPTAFSLCIERTREALYDCLLDVPAAGVLREYFQRAKMLRAFLVYAASASVGGDPDDVLMAAVAIELLHGASLFHDDIIDEASTRRGVASLHERLGVGPALVVGDGLLLKAFAALAEARARHPAARVLEATETLNALARECCRGQFDELCAEQWISEAEYLDIVRGKTAAPFVAAGVLGTLLGRGTRAHLVQIRIYAREMGIAFQIGDDLLDLVGEPRALGKPAGNSLAHGRPMLPLIYLWETSSQAEQGELRRLLGNGHGRRQELVECLEERGLLERVRRVQRRHVEAAVAALKGFRDPTGVAALRALAVRATAP